MFYSKDNTQKLQPKRTHDDNTVATLLNKTTLEITQNVDIQPLFNIISLFCNTIQTLNFESTNSTPTDLSVTKNSPNKITISGELNLLDQIFPDLGIVVNKQKKKGIY